MAEPKKNIPGRPASLPAQQAAADPLQSYCPDLDQWPSSWAYEKRDIPCGLRIVECFTPFLREMLARLSVARKTLRQHHDNIWVLGGQVIRRSGQWSPHTASRAGRPRPHRRRRRAATFHGPSETEQRSFDATCRKLFRFLTGPEISHRHNATNSTATTNRSRH